MSKYLFAFAFVALVAVVGCQKKDEGGGGGAGPACSPGYVMSPFHGRCLAQASCPQGLVQDPNQSSMCVNVATGVIQTPQQCGVGFFLTVNGCYQKGPCPVGQAMYAGACIDVLSAGTSNPYQQGGYGNQQYQTYPQYQQQQSYPQYQGYPQYQAYPNYYYGYRGY